MAGFPRTDLRELRSECSEGDRYIDLALRFVEKDGGPREIEVGGRWDRWRRCWRGTWDADEDAGLAEVVPVVVAVTGDQMSVLMFEDDRRRVLLVLGGYGAGKTLLGLLLLLVEMLTYPGDLFWCVAPEHKDCRSAYEKLTEQLPDELGIPRTWFDDERTKGSDKERVAALVNGSRVEFRSADRPYSLRARDVRGILADEPADFRDGVQDRLRLRVARQKNGWRLIYTGTPDDTLEEMIATLEQPDEKTGHVDGAIFHLDSRHNQFAGGAEGEYDLLAGRLSQREWERTVLGKLSKRPGRVFYEYATETHVRPIPDIGDITARVLPKLFDGIEEYGEAPSTILGCDFNLAPNRPLTWIVAKLFAMPGTPHGWAVWIVDEIVTTNATIERVALQAAGQYGRCLAIHDSTESMIANVRPVDAMVEAGLLCEPAGGFHARNPPMRASVDSVNAALKPVRGVPWLYVAPHCANAKKTMQALIWGQDNRIERRHRGGDMGNAGHAIRFVIHKLNPAAREVARRGGRDELEEIA